MNLVSKINHCYTLGGVCELAKKYDIIDVKSNSKFGLPEGIIGNVRKNLDFIIAVGNALLSVLKVSLKPGFYYAFFNF